MRLIITFGISLTVFELLAFVCGPEMTYAVFSARWRRRSKVNTDSETQSPTSYLWLIITLGLSLTVSELLAFICGPEMTSCRFLR